MSYWITSKNQKEAIIPKLTAPFWYYLKVINHSHYIGFRRIRSSKQISKLLFEQAAEKKVKEVFLYACLLLVTSPPSGLSHQKLIIFSILTLLLLFLGEKNLTVAMLTNWVNNEYFGFEGEDLYSEGNSYWIIITIIIIILTTTTNTFYNKKLYLETVRKWLHLCNFTVKETSKGLYFDGHERPDVIKVFV